MPNPDLNFEETLDSSYESGPMYRKNRGPDGTEYYNYVIPDLDSGGYYETEFRMKKKIPKHRVDFPHVETLNLPSPGRNNKADKLYQLKNDKILSLYDNPEYVNTLYYDVPNADKYILWRVNKIAGDMEANEAGTRAVLDLKDKLSKGLEGPKSTALKELEYITQTLKQEGDKTYKENPILPIAEAMVRGIEESAKREGQGSKFRPSGPKY